MPETTYKKTVRLILWIAGTILLLYVLYLLADVIIILALSVLLAFIFAPFVFLLEQKGFSRLTSTLIAFGALAILIYLSFQNFLIK
jgi:predicted PurR-regulated permease PerM